MLSKNFAITKDFHFVDFNCCLNCLIPRFISNLIPFLTNAAIFYPLKTPENQRFADAFREGEVKGNRKHRP